MGAAFGNIHPGHVACPYVIDSMLQPANRQDTHEQLNREMRRTELPQQDAVRRLPHPCVPPELNKTPAAVELSHQRVCHVSELQVGSII